MLLRKAVFLDRDGVINKSLVLEGKPYAPRSLNDFKLIKYVEDSINILKSTGYSIVVVTNQPDVGNEVVEREVVEEMHKKLMSVLQLDSIKVCYHAQTDGCKCRKPKPGMLLDAASEMNLDLKNSYMVGDRKSDIEAGQSVGCYSIFIDNDYSDDEKPQAPDHSVSSLKEAAQHIYHLSQQ